MTDKYDINNIYIEMNVFKIEPSIKYHFNL